MAIKEFFIYIDKPIFPPPPANYTPTPPAPRPDRFIEVPATTTCAKQGITDVPSTYCQEACEALDFKYSGGKPNVNMTGCFVLTSGKYNGSCSFNSNSFILLLTHYRNQSKAFCTFVSIISYPRNDCSISIILLITYTTEAM